MEVSCSKRGCYLDESLSNSFSFPNVGEKKYPPAVFLSLQDSVFLTSQHPTKLQCVTDDGGNRL
mgnify:CR=1